MFSILRSMDLVEEFCVTLKRGGAYLSDMVITGCFAWGHFQCHSTSFTSVSKSQCKVMLPPGRTVCSTTAPEMLSTHWHVIPTNVYHVWCNQHKPTKLKQTHKGTNKTDLMSLQTRIIQNTRKALLTQKHDEGDIQLVHLCDWGGWLLQEPLMRISAARGSLYH